MRKDKKKRFTLIAAMLLALMMPTTASAQNDGFFSDYTNADLRDNENFEISATNETFGEAPLGGGVAILVASAAGYTLLKRRKQQDSETTKNLAK